MAKCFSLQPLYAFLVLCGRENSLSPPPHPMMDSPQLQGCSSGLHTQSAHPSCVPKNFDDRSLQGGGKYVGRTGNILCPVTAVLHYMTIRGQVSGPFFIFEDGAPLVQNFVDKVKEALSQAGVDCSAYSGYSFCIAAATTAAKQGISDATIKMLGRWKSSAYQVYIKTRREQLASYSCRLGNTVHSISVCISS